MIKRGFDGTPTKQDFRDLRTEMRGGFSSIAGSLSAIHEDIQDIKVALPPLLRTVAQMELDVGDLKKRVLKVERKVGLAK